jgi:hypothetical protein
MKKDKYKTKEYGKNKIRKKKKNTRTHTNKCGEVKEESVKAMEAYV